MLQGENHLRKSRKAAKRIGIESGGTKAKKSAVWTVHCAGTRLGCV